MHKRPPRLIVLREVLKCMRAITRVAGKLYVAGGLGLKEPKEPDIVWVVSLHSPLLTSGLQAEQFFFRATPQPEKIA